MQVRVKEQTVSLLWENYKENPDVSSRNELVLYYAGLVKSIARRTACVSGSYVDVEDLISFGMLGLIKAVEKFDTDKGVSFETYATYRIRGEIIDYMRRNDWVPRGLRKRAQLIDEAQKKLKCELGRTPTKAEVAVKVGIGVDDVEKILADSDKFNQVSFEEIIEDTVKSEYNLESEKTPENTLAQNELNDMLAKAIDDLPDREKLVISLYYHEELSLKEISDILKVSESRVSQLHTKGVRTLRKILSEY
jgi:RNA polymerase sigma factor for flagellar operon FliA